MIPITLADPHRDAIPHSYVVWHKPQVCRNCGLTHFSHEVFAKTHLRSQLHASKYVTNLRPCAAPQYNLPVEVLQAPATPIPFCAACAATVDLTTFPAAPTPATHNIAADLRATDLVRNSPQHPDIEPVAKPKRARPAVTTDDLAL
jgi:hypothetical protein